MTTQTDTGLDAVTENRRLNLALIQGLFPSGAVLAKYLGVHWSLISNVKTKDAQGHYRRTIGEKLARKIEKNMGVEAGWLDRPQFPDSLPQNIIDAARDADPNTPYRRTRAPQKESLSQLVQIEAETPAPCSAIQAALMDTTKRLIEMNLLSDVDCLAVLQSWQPLIAQLKKETS